MTKLPQGSILPKWLTIEPLEDGSYVVLKDPLVQEMFDAYAERLPKYNEEKLKPFLKKEPETVMHGDFHPANHMFGVNENEGKALALDFQLIGTGLVSVDLVYFMVAATGLYDFEDWEYACKEYHTILVENGVTDYSWSELQTELEMCLVELHTSICFATMTTPEEMLKDAMKNAGDKAEDIKKLFESGFLITPILLLTGIYARDKTNFLIVK